MRQIVIALDELSLARCVELIQITTDQEQRLGNHVEAFKIHDLYDREGPGVVEKLKRAGARRIKLDRKLHDTPNTVRMSTRYLVESGADIITVHIAGGIDMMKAALEGTEGRAEVWGVTVLTSLSEEEVVSVSGRSCKVTVLCRAHMAQLVGLQAVICSPKETATLAAHPQLKKLAIVNPGIRSAGVDSADQKRVDTPENAIMAGARYIVIGREFTLAKDPAAGLARIIERVEIANDEILAKEVIS